MALDTTALLVTPNMTNKAASSLFEHICAAYGLPAFQAATPIEAGYLSQNWALETSGGTYFLKAYRFDDRTQVEVAHAARLHFHQAGIPTIVPFTTHAGQPIYTHDDHHYSLFPFVTARQLRRGALSITAIASIGTLLARLHRAGHGVQLPQLRARVLRDQRAAFQIQATELLALIARQPEQTSFDALAEQTLRRQLTLVDQTAMDYTKLGLVSDHLLHGDYHDSNLFFDEQERVCYLFDWEKAEIGARESELVRALLFTCFSNPHNFRGTFTPQNFDQGKAFLHAYQSTYPVNPERLADAIVARYWGSLCSLWVATEHYLNHNQRVDPFLEANLAEINYFADNLSRFYRMDGHDSW